MDQNMILPWKIEKYKAVIAFRYLKVYPIERTELKGLAKQIEQFPNELELFTYYYHPVIAGVLKRG